MTYRARRMLVVDRLLNIPIHTHRAAVWRLSSSWAAFLKLRVSFLPSVIPILMVMHRNTETVADIKQIAKTMSD